VIVDILKKTLFSGRKALPNLFPDDLTLTADGHIEMPAPLVAVAATLVVHLIQRDILPTPDGGWKFSSSAYRNTYKKHLGSLEFIKHANGAGLSVLLANIYKGCTYVFPLFIRNSVSRLDANWISTTAAWKLSTTTAL
jgi:hypothetical protein